jgi:hypothetical protein
MKWGGVKNGALLALIEREGFQAFLFNVPRLLKLLYFARETRAGAVAAR